LIYFYPICKADFFADVVLELARVNKVAHGGSFFVVLSVILSVMLCERGACPLSKHL
jgi:hypothetical protein